MRAVFQPARLRRIAAEVCALYRIENIVDREEFVLGWERGNGKEKRNDDYGSEFFH
jgi:hypothetical protein